MKRRGNVLSPIDSVNTLVEMLIQTDSSVEDGETVWVRSTQAMYVYRIGSGLTPDGVNVLASLYGGGVWQKLNVGAVGPGSSLGPFNTVAQGAAGSGRLLDVTAAQLGAMPNGRDVWVISVLDFWRWDAASTATADNITICNPTANGVNPGRFVRELVASLEWMSQLVWCVATGGNDENVGSVASPLATDAERQRRMGPYPTWSAGAYHLRYPNGLAASDAFVLAGRRASTSQIFVHGNLVDHTGITPPVFTGTIDALDALNRATGTNRSWQITSNALPVSWTASSLIGVRLRLTSGTGTELGAISFPMKDLTGKKARMCQFRKFVNYAVPVNPAAFLVSDTPALTDTFVCETLASIPNVLITIDAEDDFSTNVGAPIIFDSLALGAGDMNIVCSDTIIFDGCIATSFEVDGLASGVIWSGVRWTTSANVGGWAICTLAAGYSDTQMALGVNANVIVDTDFMVQGARFVVGGHVAWAHGAVFDSSSDGIGLVENGTFHGTTQGGTFFAWGQGNAAFGFAVAANYANYIAGQVAGFTITGTSGDFSIGSVATLPVFDLTTRTYLATVTTTWAHLAAAVGGGTGFGGNAVDPVKLGKLVVA